LAISGQYGTGAQLNSCTAETDRAVDDDDDDYYYYYGDDDISSHTQDTTELWPIMLLTEIHQILVIKHLTVCL
jgi:hypothetical protein